MNRVNNMIKALLAILIVVYLIGNDIGLIPDFSLWRGIFAVLFAIGIMEGLYKKEASNVIACIAALYFTIQPIINAPEISIFVLIISTILLSIACGYLFPDFKKGKKVTFGGEFYTEGKYSEEEDHVSVTFSDIEKYISSKKLEAYNVDCSFGEVKLYFDNAEMLNNEAILNVSIHFGELVLFVPKDWSVVPNVSNVFSEKSCVGQAEGPTKTLNIEGNLRFSSIRVIYI